MENKIIVYHGSKEIISKPTFGKGKLHNDFGLGFYCTEYQHLSKEWAVNMNKDGYCNKYELDMTCLNILNLNNEKYSILNWIAILVEHRLFSIDNPGVRKARQYLIDNFSINVNSYDAIIGYRADDFYFDYAEQFLNNSITVTQLGKAMQLGKLGEQIVIKSQFGFDSLTYLQSTKVLYEEYYKLKQERTHNANKEFLEILEQEDDGLYIQDIIKGGIKNDDARIPRNIRS